MAHGYVMLRKGLMALLFILLACFGGSVSGQVSYGTPAKLAGANDPTAFETESRWTPDGQYLLFSSNLYGNFDIFRVPAEGGTPERLTDAPAHESEPVLSSDNWLYYTVRAEPRIYRKRIGSATSEFVVTGSDPQLSPDGTFLIYYLGDYLYRFNLLTRTNAPLNIRGAHPRLSKDGLLVAYESYSNYGVWVASAVDGSGKRQVSTRINNSNDGGGGLDWSPNQCQKLVFFGAPSFAPPCGQGDLWTINLDRSSPQQITFGKGATWPSWSEDGTKIAFSSCSDGDIYLMDVSGCGGVAYSKLSLVGNSELPTGATCGVPQDLSFVVRNIGDAWSSPVDVVCSLFVLDRCDQGVVNSFWCKIWGLGESIVRETHTSTLRIPAIGPSGREGRVSWSSPITFVSPHYTDQIYLKLSSTDGTTPIDGSDQISIDNYFTNFTVATNPDALSNCAFELISIVATGLDEAKGAMAMLGMTADALSRFDECILTLQSEGACALDQSLSAEERGNCVFRALTSAMGCVNDNVGDYINQHNWRWDRSLQALGVVLGVISSVQTEFLENAGCASVFVDGCVALRQYSMLPLRQYIPGGGIGLLLCSPMDLQAVDDRGNSNIVYLDGSVVTQTPYASGTMLDHSKALVLPPSSAYQISLLGRESGMFSFSMFLPMHDAQTVEVRYENIECTPTTTATLNDIAAGSQNFVMEIDRDGDSHIDTRLLPTSTSDSAHIQISVTIEADFSATGVAVDVYDARDSLVVQLFTDADRLDQTGKLMAGEYHVAVIPPLGFTCDTSIKTVVVDGSSDVVDVNFTLVPAQITSVPRSRGFWGMQLQKALWNKPEQYTRADFSRFASLIGQHFNDNRLNSVEIYTVPQPATQNDSLLALKDLLPLWPVVTEEPFVKRLAKAELVALMLNVAACKISQTQAITKDSMTVSQAITYCDMLINEPGTEVLWLPDSWMPEYDHYGPLRSYIGANLIGGFINYGKMLPAGSIPSDIENIAYKHESEEKLPGLFTLFQNYPNPFNPSTDISFDLPVAAEVRLELFNVLGQRVAALLDQTLEAGHHAIRWDGAEAASGVYLYRLQAGEFVETRKMLLLK
ncbi:MAG: T9SS type A sorting domain-containing protein [Candidatus Zixiibacteriota bacterium]